MKHFKNIFFVFAAILILLPPVVSFSHIFSGHGHGLCDNYAEHHYHSKSIDCELHKFNKKSGYTFEFIDFTPITEDSESEEIFDYYSFLNDFEPLHFDLRGPPNFA